MKHILYVFITICLLNSKVDAQVTETTITAPALLKTSDEEGKFKRVEFGVRYLPTFAVLKLNTSDGGTVEGKANISHGFGALLGVNVTKHVGVQTEINYYKVTQSYKDQALDRKIDISYVNVPLLISLNTNKANHFNLNVVAGPQYGINVGSNINTSGSGNSDTLQAVIAIKKGDWGIAYGGGMDIAINESQTVRLDIGYRGFFGLTSIKNDAKNDANTFNVVQKVNRRTNGGYIGLTLLF